MRRNFSSCCCVQIRIQQKAVPGFGFAMSFAGSQAQRCSEGDFPPPSARLIAAAFFSK